MLSKNKIKLITSLRHKKNRDLENLFIVEGKKNVSEAVKEYPGLIEFICTTDQDFSGEFTIYHTDDITMKSLSKLQSGRDYIGVFRKPEHDTGSDGIILVLDGIQDPGNLGTIIRTADWFGVTQLVCSDDTVDAFNEKVVQASMGSIFRSRIIYTNLTEYLKQVNQPVYGALLSGENIYEAELSPEGIYVLGNEGNGIRPAVVERISHPVHIPGKGKAESLNVAIAAGIIMSEVFRRN